MEKYIFDVDCMYSFTIEKKFDFLLFYNWIEYNHVDLKLTIRSNFFMNIQQLF